MDENMAKHTTLSILTSSLCCLLLTACGPGSRIGTAPASTPTPGNEVRTHGPVAAPAAHGSDLSRFIIPDTLDAWIEREMERRRIPGLSLAIARAGEVLAARAYGLADVQNQVPASPATRFDLASLTKAITAAGILLLVEDGKLDLDAPISTYLTEAPENWAGVTTRHLLNHTSGLPGMGAAFTGRTIPYPLDVSEQDSYDAARGDTLFSHPGEKYLYSDVGYFLLGVITGRVSGMRWRDFVQSRIFDRLGMSDSYILDRVRIHRNEARGYTISDGELANIRRVHQVETPSHHGAHSNVLDLVKWDAALYGNQLLSEASRTAMWTPARLIDGSAHPHGFGWNIWCQRGHPVHQHTGITGTEIFRLPGDTLTVIVLTNLGLGARSQASEVNAWGIAPLIAEMVFPGVAPSSRAQRLTESELQLIVGEYRYTGDEVTDPAIRLVTEQGRLYLQDSDGHVMLHSIANDILVLDGAPFVILLERNDSGRVEAWRAHHAPEPTSGTVRSHSDCPSEPDAAGRLIVRAVRVSDASAPEEE
jgi:D-alanyl-D-alanine carboxypeptidase